MKVAIIGAMDKEIETYLELYNPELVDEKRKIYVKGCILIFIIYFYWHIIF